MDTTQFRELLVMMRNDRSFRRMVRDIMLEPDEPKEQLRALPPADVRDVPPGYLTRQTAREIMDCTASALRGLIYAGYVHCYGHNRDLLKVDEFTAYVLKRKNVAMRQRMLDWLQANGHLAKEARKVERMEDRTQLALAV